jgi:hypothetical protein
MSANYTEIVILCEGKQDEVFLRRFLKQNGYGPHRVRTRPYPAGRGSGKQFVQDEYAKEVVEHRRRANRMNIALIVMHDCDTETIEGSRAMLERSARRSPHERIALLLPRRNIETWIHFLQDGGPVDESTSYPKLLRESECHNVADRIAAKNEYRLSIDVPHSLRAACPEIRRIFPQKRCVEQVE